MRPLIGTDRGTGYRRDANHLTIDLVCDRTSERYLHQAIKNPA
ncbi:hypothetical protein NK6_4888 [Bradyrhizobium diazoefficiens]|uniref:Uncharacterized protein n=1 Tax=Bradyrhizobium diazoefficiens TaxID=1355477 RepID=A0A0E4FW90_9BRAD|nr:hypothetical protein NK6_4888 [Bradyrhizobium diazoefficiens]